MLFKQPYDKSEHITPLVNVGAGFDIILGKWYDGIHGEAVLNGGAAQLNGFVGDANLFKTTVMLYKMLMVMARIFQSTGSLYETEMNTQAQRVLDLSGRIPEFGGEDILETERMIVTNRARYDGGAWYDQTKEFLDFKYTQGSKNKQMRGKLPFLKKGSTSELMESIIFTCGGLDSFTDFVTKDVAKMNDDVTLGDKGAETMFMKQGLPKLRLLSEMPPLLAKAAHYFFMTAQVGPIFNMDQYNPEKKKLSNMVGNVKMKGVTDKFTYIMNSILQFHKLEKLQTKEKKPEFPRDKYDDSTEDGDLNVLSAVELRGKNGPSGIPLKIVVSQREGVLPSMTEFYNLLRVTSWEGLEGNDQNYSLALCPDIKLSRQKIRPAIDEHAALRRALNISGEIAQMSRYMPEIRNSGLMCTGPELFQGIKERGYDWDEILGNTRGWWTINNDEHPVPFLSSLDLLRMRKDKYKPYWM